MAMRTDVHQNKHHFRDNLIPETNEGLDVGVTGQRFATGRFANLIADTATFITLTVTTIVSVTINTLTVATALTLSFLGAGYLKTSAGGVVSAQTTPLPAADLGSGASATTVLHGNQTFARVALGAGGDVTGTLPVGSGGIGVGTLTANGLLLGQGTSPVTAKAAMAKGSLIVGQTGADPTELVVGTDTFVLTADSAQGAGIKWAAASGGGGFNPIANQVFGG